MKTPSPASAEVTAVPFSQSGTLTQALKLASTDVTFTRFRKPAGSPTDRPATRRIT